MRGVSGRVMRAEAPKMLMHTLCPAFSVSCILEHCWPQVLGPALICFGMGLLLHTGLQRALATIHEKAEVGCWVISLTRCMPFLN